MQLQSWSPPIRDPLSCALHGSSLDDLTSPSLNVAPDSLGKGAVKGILDVFGTASGLQVNYTKSSANVLHGDDSDAGLIELLGCPVATLPITYLGILLTTRRPSAAQLQPLSTRRRAGFLPGRHG